MQPGVRSTGVLRAARELMHCADHELVDVHGRVDSDFAAEVGVELDFFHAARRAV